MEYLPPEPEPQLPDGPPPMLEYATPTPKDPSRTPMYVRVIGLIASGFALLFGLLCGFGTVFEWIDRVRRWKTWDVPEDMLRFLLVSGILIIVGVLGIRAARRFKTNGEQGR